MTTTLDWYGCATLVALGHDVDVEVFPSQHSCVWSHDHPIASDEVCLGDLGATWQEQQERLGDLTAWMRSLYADAKQRGVHNWN